jgi:anti-sigma regulatory factor (Ser/Thr protein kinase)
MTNGPPRWLRELTVPATEASVPTARRWVEQLAAESGLRDGGLFEFVLAVGEALANAVRHGSPHGGQNQVTVLFSRLPGGVSVEVRDEGGGFVSSPLCPPDVLAGAGRGITFMRRMSDELEFECGPAGTRVRLVKHLAALNS